MSCLFLFGCLISKNNPEHNATTFIAFLLVTPMFMIDKPFFMTIELVAASVVFLLWMYAVKPFEVWEMDLINVVSYTSIGCFLNVVANSIRIKEFVLTKKIRIQKDTDAMTGLRNKGALTREIDEFLEDESTDKGLLFIMDIDKFKSINDNYGHEAGDKAASKIMARSIKELTDCNIAIGTTAGIGHGAISIITDDCEITTTTDVYADLCENNSEELFQRSENGIEKALEIVLLLLNDDLDKIESFENVEIR